MMPATQPNSRLLAISHLEMKQKILRSAFLFSWENQGSMLGFYLMCSLHVATCLVVLLRLLFWEPVKMEMSASSAVISMPKSNTKIKKSLPEIWQAFHIDEDRRDKVFLGVRVNNSPFGPQSQFGNLLNQAPSLI